MPELTRPVAICTPRGTLNPGAAGWSRQPLHDGVIPRARWGRRKRWEYWCVLCETHALAVTLADLDFAGLAVVTFMDFTKAPVERAVVWPVSLPDRPHEAPVRFHRLGLHVDVVPNGSRTWLEAHIGDLEARVTIERGGDSLNVLVPWDERTFQFTSKQVALPARGEVRIGPRTWTFGEGAFATLDFGRGLWPRETRWNWGCGAGQGIGLNLGGQWTDGTGQTENGVVVDGRLHKLEERVVFDGLSAARSQRVELTFESFASRDLSANLGLLAGSLQLRFGRWHGRVLLDDGSPLKIDGLLGWAEEASLRW